MRDQLREGYDSVVDDILVDVNRKSKGNEGEGSRGNQKIVETGECSQGKQKVGDVENVFVDCDEGRISYDYEDCANEDEETNVVDNVEGRVEVTNLFNNNR